MLVSKTCWFIGLGLMLQAPLRGELPAPFTAAAFGKHVAYLADDQRAGRAPGTAGSAQALDYLRQQLQQAGLGPLGDAWVQPFPLESPAPHSGALFGKNLVAVWPGRGRLQSEAVIVSAHYDHEGADGAVIYLGHNDLGNRTQRITIPADKASGSTFSKAVNGIPGFGRAYRGFMRKYFG